MIALHFLRPFINQLDRIGKPTIRFRLKIFHQRLLVSPFSCGLLAIVAITCLAHPEIACAGDSKITLNQAGLEHAKALIRDGHVVSDKRDWQLHRPTPDAQTAFLARYGWAGYGRWYLGVDSSAGETTRRRYKFPFGDFSDVHRSALIAAKARAIQYHYDDIRDAAAELLKMIDRR